MNYHCPQCQRLLKVPTLFFHDVSTCPTCGQKVVLGDMVAFFVAALVMLVSTLTALYILSERLQDYFVAAGYALAIGIAAGLVVMLLLGRATPVKRGRRPKLDAHA